MNNCLKTTFKGVVDNDNLPIYGRLVLKHYVRTTDKEAPLIIKGQGVKVSVSTPNYFTVDEDTEQRTSYELPDGNVTKLKFTDGVYDIIIDNKYDLIVLGTSAGSTSILDAIGMNIEDAAYLTNLEGLRWYYNGKCSYGSINSLGRLVHLGENFSAAYNNQLNCLGMGSINITGSIEEFVAAQAANGRTINVSSPIQSNLRPTGVTFGGQNLRHWYTSLVWFTWESATKIAMYAGSSVADSASVYVTGYSALEIATKQASGGIWEGKTVTDVATETVYPAS